MGTQGRSVLKRISAQLELPFPQNAKDLENLSMKILEQELARQRALVEPVNSKKDSDV